MTAVHHDPEPELFEVFVGKEDFKFSCSHFVAFEGYRERLHGHNYSVGVRLKGQVLYAQRYKGRRHCKIS